MIFPSCSLSSDFTGHVTRVCVGEIESVLLRGFHEDGLAGSVKT